MLDLLGGSGCISNSQGAVKCEAIESRLAAVGLVFHQRGNEMQGMTSAGKRGIVSAVTMFITIYMQQ